MRLMAHPNVVELKQCFYTSDKNEVCLAIVSFDSENGLSFDLITGHHSVMEVQCFCTSDKNEMFPLYSLFSFEWS